MRTNPERGPEGLPCRIAAQPIGQGVWDTGFPASGGAVEGRYMVGPGKLMSRRIAEPVPPELPGSSSSPARSPAHRRRLRLSWPSRWHPPPARL